jgi:hypothetical protein
MKQGEIRGKGMVKSPDSASLHQGYLAFRKLPAPRLMKAHELLPGVHRVASLVKRWLLGIHQGSVEVDHLQAYLDEFTFRFNRRRSWARGMLFYRLIQ